MDALDALGLHEVLLASPDPTHLAQTCRLAHTVAINQAAQVQWYGRHATDPPRSPYRWRHVSRAPGTAAAEALVVALLAAGHEVDGPPTMAAALVRDHARVVRRLVLRLPPNVRPEAALRLLHRALRVDAVAVARELCDAANAWIAVPLRVGTLATMPATALAFILPLAHDDVFLHADLAYVLHRRVDSVPHIAAVLRHRPALARVALVEWLRPGGECAPAALRAIAAADPALLPSTDLNARVLAMARPSSSALAALAGLRDCSWLCGPQLTTCAAIGWTWVYHACYCGHAQLLAELCAESAAWAPSHMDDNRNGGGGGGGDGGDGAHILASGMQGLRAFPGHPPPSWVGLLFLGWWVAADPATYPGPPHCTAPVPGSCAWAAALGVLLACVVAQGSEAGAEAGLLWILKAMAAVRRQPAATHRLMADIVWPLLARSRPPGIAATLFLAAALGLFSLAIHFHLALRRAAGSDEELRCLLPHVLPLVTLRVSAGRPCMLAGLAPDVEEACRVQLLAALSDDSVRLAAVPREQAAYLCTLAARVA